MNIRIDYYDEQDLSYADKSPKQAKQQPPSASRRSSTSRRAKGPVQVNGIHRRRRKRMTW